MSVTRAILVLSLVLGAAALSPGRVNPALAEEACSVTIDAPADVAGDSDFVVSIDIGNVAAFDAGQFDICYDDSEIELKEVTAGEIGATEIPVDLWSKMGAGTYRIIVNVPGVPGVSGSGTLAVVRFHTVGSAAGSSALDLSNGFLNSNLGTEIPATWIGRSINRLEEPGTPAGPDSENPSDAMAQSPTFSWWLLSAIIGTAFVLIGAMIAVVMLRRRQLAGQLQTSGDRQPEERNKPRTGPPGRQ